MKELIFSKKIAPRLARHLAFWGLYFGTNVLTHLPEISKWGQANHDDLTGAFTDAIVYLPLYMLAVYSAIYLVLPIYLKKRKLQVLFYYWFALLAISIPIGYLITEKNYMRQGFDSDALDIFSTALHICFANLIVFTIAAVSIKIMKDYWLRQREHEKLAIENIRNNLQMLKMQMHPRILFASLQRIYLEIEQQTREAPEMILKLSDLLSYLLYESDAEKVPLTKEVQMIENYLALKKMEYKHNVGIHFETTGRLEHHWITPGLLLPLLEIGIERANAIAQMSAVTIQLKSLGPMLIFTLKTDVPGKALAIDPAAQTTIRMVKERLRDAGFQRWKLDLLAGTANTTITMQLERAIGNVGNHQLKTINS
jgi:two-component system, LytTR family, sensor kinase